MTDWMMNQAMEIGGIDPADFNDPDDVFYDPEDRGVPPLSEPRPKPTETIWVTREGQRIAVVAMGDQHIINTVRYIRRRASSQLMRQTLNMSDAAEMAVGTEFDDFDATDDDYVASTCPTFPALLAEAEKRGLEL